MSIYYLRCRLGKYIKIIWWTVNSFDMQIHVQNAFHCRWYVLIISYLGPFYLHELTLIPAWISIHMPSEVWDELTYPFPKFQRLNRWSQGMESNYTSYFTIDVILYSYEDSSSNHVSKRVYWGIRCLTLQWAPIHKLAAWSRRSAP